jgi:hypothetical protein
MTLYDEIIAVYPELTLSDFDLTAGNKVILADDGDGIQYISKWEYSNPLPEGMKVGK